MKEIKVYLQYPWKFPDSPYYKYLIQSPPKNILFLNAENQKGAMTSMKKFWISNFLKKNIREYFNRFNTAIVNAHRTKTDKKYDLIQCAHCLSLNNSPWVADFECGWQFFIGKETERVKNKAKKLILSSHCKKLLAWTEETKKEMIKILPEIKEKIEVVYPAIPSQKIRRKKHSKINLVFVARYFRAKGGYHALEVMKRITKKYKNVRGIIVSTVPEEILKENKENKSITFYPLLPQKEVFEKIYPLADISIYPAYADSFGFGILEAMAFGIPIISVDGYSRKELVEDGKTGFVINNSSHSPNNRCDYDWENIDPAGEKAIKEMVKKVIYLIKNAKKRKSMSNNCINEIKHGKFSIVERNKKLKRIYENALK